MPNPFAYGARVTDPSRFVGRTNELRRIFAMLDTAHTGQLQSVSVVGERRIGKSSLLYHLTQTFKKKLSQPERYVFAYIDLQENSATASLPTLNAHIINTLRNALPSSLPYQPPSTALSLIEFESAIKQFELAKLVPVLCVDEFEKLIEHPEIFPNVLYDSWRSLMNSSHAAFVVASHLPLHEIVKSTKLTSSFFNIFSDFITLGELTNAEARELINWGKTCDQPFTQSECDWAIHTAGNHPYKIQLAGWLIYNAKPNVVWSEVEEHFEAQVERVLPHPKGFTTRIKEMILALGGVVNEWRGKPKDNPESNWIWGWTVLVGLPVITTLVLVVGVPLFLEMIKMWMLKK